MRQPFLDLTYSHRGIQHELEAAYRRVIKSGQLVLGPEVEAFEEEFAVYNEVAFCIGVGNGLDALYLMLKAYGIGPGDEVIVPANTFVATWLAISRCGARIVPAEPDMATCNLDASAVEALITPRTRAILPVHLFGQPADMEAINAVAEKYRLLVLADAAQAQGARYLEKAAAVFSDATATSFYPGKNLGALGDGGAVLTNDRQIAEKIRQLRNYGSSAKYRHDNIGCNSRLDELQAAFLRVKLTRLDEWNAYRSEIARCYYAKLTGSDIVLPTVIEAADPVWHLFVVRLQQRDRAQEKLSIRGITTLIHYPVPPHRQACYRDSLWQALPVTEQLADEMLSLPIYPGLTLEQTEWIADALLDAVCEYDYPTLTAKY